MKTKSIQNRIAHVVVNKDFDRLSFTGLLGIKHEIRREGGNVSLVFSAPVDFDLRELSKSKRARDFLISKEEKNGKHFSIIKFSISPEAIIKTFAKSGTVFVDINSPPLPAPETAQPSAPEKQKKTEDKPQEQAKGEEQKTPENQQVKPSKEIASADEKQKTEQDTKEQNTQPIANSQTTASPNPVSEITQKTDDKPELAATFDPGIATGLAVFERAGFVTIVFERKLTMDLSALTSSSPLKIKLSPLDLPKNTAFRFSLPAGASVRVSRSGTAWKIFFVKDRNEPAISTSLIAQPEFALGARMMLPTKEPSDPVIFTDPIVGDDLIIVPLRDNASFSVPRFMVDFSVIPSAQGLVIKPLHEKVIVRSFAEGVEITAEGGLKLSPSSESGVAQQTARKLGGGRTGAIIFDINSWKGKQGESFTSARRKLTQTIIEVPETQRNLARLELARFYFARGMGEEALALLAVLAKNSPELLSHPEYLALRGAANILAGRPQEGLRDLKIPELDSQAEIKLWQAVAQTQLREWSEAEEKFNFVEELLANYPEPFHSRFSILAIEAAIGADKDREAAEWLERLDRKPHLPEIDPAIKYLRGVLHSKSGRAEAAEKLWKEVAQSSDRLYKIRAELALVDLKVALGSFTPQQAADRLEGLRYAWRGDDLELDILRRLGNFHIEAGNYKSGLAMLAQAVRLYPKSPLAAPVRADMTKTFRDLFLGDAGAKISPVDAFTIFQTYPDLVPQGEDGFRMKSNLAEKLISIDLLDQAAALLEDIVKNSLKGEDKMRAGARLAAIRLLDKKPNEAIAALEMSQAEIPASAEADDINSQRQLLRARALSEQGKLNEALDLLKNNGSKNAKILRADIEMRAKRWKEAGLALLDLVGAPPKPGEQITEEQAQWLVKCAIAFSLAGDISAVDRLAIDYGAAMSVMPQKDTFRVLTRPESIEQMRDIATAQIKIAEVDMFRGFLNSYRDPNHGKKKDAEKKP